MKVVFISLGCDKNTVDTQQMAGMLQDSAAQYTFTDDEEEADIAVVNTCAFINSAKEESIGQILSLAERRKNGQLKALIVTGCLAQRYQEEIGKDIPEVDAVLGTTAEDQLGIVLDGILHGKSAPKVLTADLDKVPAKQSAPVLSLESPVGYLKIAEGCNKCCSYCVIPSLRGHYRSVPMEQVLEDAKTLLAGGVRELILVAQETTLYGVDLYGKKMLPELLRRLCLLGGVRWIRILYCYPEEITKELVEVVRSEPRIVPYFDMPIQHASDKILKAMGRRTNRKELEEIIGYIREQIPNVCLRTTLITGFPGETEEDHRELLSFVRRMKFDRLGVFTYSKEEGTPAAAMKNQVHPSTKKRRQKELMLLQQQIAFDAAEKMKDKVLDVIIEGKIADEDVYVGRTYKDIPGVDSNIFVETKRELMTGDFIKAKVTGADGYDLIGEIYYESAQ
ncbi:MAG TPA: 30S ribosomal protein S12 methylthiotransferase RimO [Lachnospiraceae bacterium]|nr:30S ribosomal protein S12 methylthiotransferase RimO [Lachnospiraceae bacterium]